jgi:hypothetical protein
VPSVFTDSAFKVHVCPSGVLSCFALSSYAFVVQAFGVEQGEGEEMKKSIPKKCCGFEPCYWLNVPYGENGCIGKFQVLSCSICGRQHSALTYEGSVWWWNRSFKNKPENQYCEEVIRFRKVGL